MYQFEGRTYRTAAGLWIYCEYYNDYQGQQSLLANSRLRTPPVFGPSDDVHVRVLQLLSACCTEMSENFRARQSLFDMPESDSVKEGPEGL